MTGRNDRLLTQTDSEKVSKRLTFVTRLSKGATLADAADDVGMSQSTGSRWAILWNKGGLGLLAPSFGGGRPPKLTETQRERLLDLLEEGELWKKQEIQNLINQEFHPNYLPRLLDDLGLSDAIPRLERPDRPENAEEILNERVADAFAEDDGDEPHNKQPADDSDNEWTLDDDVRTDGGTTVGFFNISHPQPWDNSQRLYTVNEPKITRPLVTIDTLAAGFSALNVNGESVLQFPPNQEKKQICACFEERREQNPFLLTRILLVLDSTIVKSVS